MPPVAREVAREVVREDVREVVREAVPPALRSTPIRTAYSMPAGPAGTSRRRSRNQVLRGLLSSPGAARQAFVLREVLGPPVSLRTELRDRPD